MSYGTLRKHALATTSTGRVGGHVVRANRSCIALVVANSRTAWLHDNLGS